MESRKCGKLKRSICNKRGELLVESIASFVILIIIIAAATGMVFASINMNQKSDDANAKLEQDIKIVENNDGENGKVGTMTISLDGVNCIQNIVVKDAGTLTYFIPKE